MPAAKFGRFARQRMTKRGEITLRGVTYKFAGGLEEKLLKQLDELLPKGVLIVYEPGLIRFPVPEKKGWYKPDVLLPNGIIVEGKGLFASKDRQKMLNVKREHPGLDIRFVFSNPNSKIGKKSKTTYGMWCEFNNFQYAAKEIPQEWIDEPGTRHRIDAAKAAIN